ncbi:MAG: hypothetical protein WCJ27_03510 [Verrucomicrobiota bacterium]
MKLIPLLLTLGMLAVSGWAEDAKLEPYSAELVKNAEAGDAEAQYNLAYALSTAGYLIADFSLSMPRALQA